MLILAVVTTFSLPRGEQERLDRARERWAENDLLAHGDYAYEYRESCFACFNRDWQKVVVYASGEATGPTVEDWHDQVQRLLDDPPPVLNITYHEGWGSPSMIEYDNPEVTDSGYTMEIRELKGMLIERWPIPTSTPVKK